MSSSDMPRLRLTSPGDIAQLVPHLLGFPPEESLVLVVVDSGVVAVTARVDLAEVQSQRNLEQLLGRIWARFPGAGAIAMTYTSDHDAGWDTLARVDAHLPWQADRQLMLVDGDTWHVPGGYTGTVDEHGVVAAEAREAGLQKLERRSDLAARLASAEATDELSDEISAVLDRLPAPGDSRRLVKEFSSLLATNLPRPGTARTALSTEDAIAMAILSQNPAVRDVALLSMTRETARQHLQLWCEVVNQTPAYGAERPLLLAGMAAWISGEGALATMALQRAEQAVLPGDPAGVDLLSHVIDQVVPPSTWDGLRPEALAGVPAMVRAAVEKVTAPESPEAWETINAPIRTTRHSPRDTTPPAPGIAI